jgi:hypothetical protein
MTTTQTAAAPTPLLHTLTPGEWLSTLEADLAALMDAEAEARALSLTEQEFEAERVAAFCASGDGHRWVDLIDDVECQTCGLFA